jgi:hypothetical protein
MKLSTFQFVDLCSASCVLKAIYRRSRWSLSGRLSIGHFIAVGFTRLIGIDLSWYFNINLNNLIEFPVISFVNDEMIFAHLLISQSVLSKRVKLTSGSEVSKQDLTSSGCGAVESRSFNNN